MTAPVLKHDFSAVNAFVDREYDRSKEVLRDVRANRWTIWSQVWIKGAIAAAILIVAIGLIIWLYSILERDGLHINLTQQDKFSEQQIAKLEDEFAQVRKEISIMMSANSVKERELLEKLNSFPESTIQGDQISFKFTAFESVLLSDDEAVVTGRQYDPSDITVPESIYCYYKSGNSAFEEVTHLSAKLRGHPIEWHPDAPSRLLALGREHCRFEGY